MTRLPPKRVTNSAGEATVKSRCRSIFLCSRPLFARFSPDMLGLRRDATAVSAPSRVGHAAARGVSPGGRRCEEPGSPQQRSPDFAPTRLRPREAINPFAC